MQRGTEKYLQANRILQADKSVMSDACKALVLQDFADKINEYFDLIGLPRMSLEYKNGEYTVQLSFQAERIKKFNVLK